MENATTESLNITADIVAKTAKLVERFKEYLAEYKIQDVDINIGRERQFYIVTKQQPPENLDDYWELWEEFASNIRSECPNVVDFKRKRVNKNEDSYFILDNLYYSKVELNLKPLDILDFAEEDTAIAHKMQEIVKNYPLTIDPRVFINKEAFPCAGHHHIAIYGNYGNKKHNLILQCPKINLKSIIIKNALNLADVHFDLICQTENAFHRLFENKLVRFKLSQSQDKADLGIMERGNGYSDKRLELRFFSGGIPYDQTLHEGFGSNPYLSALFIAMVLPSRP